MPERTLERELKLALPGQFALPQLKLDGEPLSVEPLPELVLRAHYHDTDALRLARHGVTLRHRSGEPGGPAWTLKLPTVPPAEGITEREELNFPGSAREMPGAARDLVSALVRTAELRPVATLRTRRRRWMVRHDDTDLAELTDDEVSVIEGRRIVARFRELEVEARSEAAPLEQLRGQLLAAGAVAAEPIPKVVRALGSRATAAPDVVVGPLGRDATMADLVRASIGDAALRVMRQDALARLGEVEGVHQLRVATRRLRSDLRTLDGFVDPGWVDRILPELTRLADALGAVRDLDVQRERFETDAGELHDALAPLWATFAARHAEATAALSDALRNPRYAELLDALVAAAGDPPVTAAAASPAAEIGPRLMLDAWRRLERRAQALDRDAPDTAFHAVRIRAKRARYAAECIARGLQPRRASSARRFAERLADLQDLLGGVQDGAVAVATLRATADGRPRDARFALAAGRLIERELARGEDAREAFAELWVDLRRPRWRRWAAM